MRKRILEKDEVGRPDTRNGMGEGETVTTVGMSSLDFVGNCKNLVGI